MIIQVEPYRPMHDALMKKLDEMGKGDSAKEVMLKAIKETAAWTISYSK